MLVPDIKTMNNTGFYAHLHICEWCVEECNHYNRFLLYEGIMVREFCSTKHRLLYSFTYKGKTFNEILHMKDPRPIGTHSFR